MKKLVFFFYRKIFANKIFYGFNRYLFTLSLKGLGINNYENEYYSGEDYFMKKLKFINSNITVFDVGANIGNYAEHIIKLFPKINLYSFEPHPEIFSTLNEKSNNKYKVYNFGFGDEEKEILLYDYKAEPKGSEHASIYKDVFTSIYNTDTVSYNIKLKTIDSFIKDEKINRITLLKSDTEGNDYAVLKGAQNALKNNLIDIIHFEFNSMNTVSRVFFKDFYDLLINFDIYRLLPKGVIKLNNYEPVYDEIFGYQNIVAINKNSIYKDIFR